MYLFILRFLQFYVQFSVLCLIKDIFLGEYNLIKYNLQDTVNNYKNSFKLNNSNLVNMIPYFVILDIVYSGSDDYNYFRAFFQTFFQIYYSYFMYKMISVFRKQRENNHMICVYNILTYNIKDIYLFYLLPISFLPFFIGLNKLTIDICFHGYLFYIFLKNSNFHDLINYTTLLETYLNIYEFDKKITNIFYIVEDKCSDIEFLNNFYNSLSNHNESCELSNESSNDESSNDKLSTELSNHNESNNTFTSILSNKLNNINDNDKKNI